MSLVEQHKYEAAYQDPKYRMGPGRKQYVTADIESLDRSWTYLDVGCGRGETLEMAEERGIKATGIESVPYLCDGERIIHADACALPFPDNAFDVVSCYDVLEHLPPGDEQTALDEFKRVARKLVLLSTNDRRSRLPDGTELHVNRQPVSAWQSYMEARWDDVKFTKQRPHGDWHWRLG